MIGGPIGVLEIKKFEIFKIFEILPSLYSVGILIIKANKSSINVFNAL